MENYATFIDDMSNTTDRGDGYKSHTHTSDLILISLFTEYLICFYTWQSHLLNIINDFSSSVEIWQHAIGLTFNLDL